MALLLAWSGLAQAAGSFTGWVAQVHDGDTIEVERAGERVRVRHWGVNCAEMRNPRADDARRFVEG